MEIYDQNVLEILNADPEIKTLTEAYALHDRLIAFRTHLFTSGAGEFIPHYRSEQVFGWNIMPGIFRAQGAQLSPDKGKKLEKEAVQEFERVVIEKIGDQAFRDLFNQQPNGKNWDLLFQAQHGSIRTSLIDWTMYIKISIFFGVEESPVPEIESSDAQLWAYMLPEPLLLNPDAAPHKESYHTHDPFKLMKGFMTNVPIYMDELEERIYEQRISRQGGRFYISPADRCNVPMNKQDDIAKYLFRFHIPTGCKAIIRKELNDQGVNRASIYVKENPDHLIWTNAINKKIYGF